MARLWISSWMSTVLPTPAPPKRPTLPPLMYGAIRSTTLSPVSKISTFGERSRNAGGSRWIGQRSASSAGTAPSRRSTRRSRSRGGRASAARPERRSARRCRRRRRRARGRRSSPSRRRGRGRRRGAAAPRRRACPVGGLDLEGGEDLGQEVREDGVDDDALDLDDLARRCGPGTARTCVSLCLAREGFAGVVAGAAKAPGTRPESSPERPTAARRSVPVTVPLERRRHPGVVVEASAARRHERGGDHPTSVPGTRRAVRCVQRCSRPQRSTRACARSAARAARAEARSRGERCSAERRAPSARCEGSRPRSAPT